MGSQKEFVEYVCDQIKNIGEVRYKKMFGEYMVYVNHKPILLICDDTVYVKIRKETEEILNQTEKGYPYPGAKEHYILDIDDQDLAKRVVFALEKITPIPNKKKKKRMNERDLYL